MWAAVERGLQPEVVLPDLQPSAGVDYLTAPESGKPEGDVALSLTGAFVTPACTDFGQTIISVFNKTQQKLTSEFCDPSFTLGDWQKQMKEDKTQRGISPGRF